MIADQDLEEARRSNGELTRDSEDAKGRADALRKALTDALAKIEAHAREAAVATAAAARLSQAEESSGRVEAENQKLREALDQAESRLADAERARVDAETAVEKHVDSVRGVEGELDAAHAEIDARVTRERELADQIESLCEALLINEGKTGGGSGVDGAMSVEVARLRQELRKSEQVLRDASSRAATGGFKRAEYLAAIEERAAGAERERDRLQSMMSPMRDELERLTAIVNEKNTSVDRASAARERDVLLAELESQKDVVREAMAMNATARASGGVLDLEKLEEELRAAEAALVSSRAAEQVASIEAEAARADAAKRVENEREAARREQERLAKEHEAMGQKLGETRADAAESSRRADDLAARVQSLEARCSQAEAARDEASARFAAAAEGETNLAARLKAVEAAAAAREAELAEHLKTAKMTKLMYRWRNQSTSHAFMSWRDNVREIKRTMRVVEKVAGAASSALGTVQRLARRRRRGEGGANAATP
jgi:chromosome segregation ATPase